VYALVPEITKRCEVTLSAQSPDGEVSYKLSLDPKHVIEGKLIHTLAAKALIKSVAHWMCLHSL
jgi:hypothetical protein